MAYLKSRALRWASVQFFRLGYVGNPLPGHEVYAGKLCIPYITRSGVVSLRFRTLPDPNPDYNPDDPGSPEWLPVDGPKYLSVAGDLPRLFNTCDLDRREPFVCIAEGEFDAMTAHQAGFPAVAVPGVNGWSAWWARCFRGYETVYILCDNDDKGQGAAFGEKIAAQIGNSRIVMMPEGHDVNSYVVAEGFAALIEKIGVEL
ncbi:toprim domain-containing protein [Micromonospora sp. WMMA1363]|uniref:toprim domain-containing protein n=1 Tax=Micromonospora sp. WMMA1363 TaxID=3053985 RepID=UPI00259CBF67|nr:toprim domain-containing protein [Micromonospora sp. WMMA1363]MDM4718424.1 toprim domain-containing protein [Micromonospora sp. WMMA1363]